MYLSSSVPTSKYRYIIAAFITIFTLLGPWSWSWPEQKALLDPAPPIVPVSGPTPPTSLASGPSYLALAGSVSDYLTAYPLSKNDFGQMGKRLQILKELMVFSETADLSLVESEALADDIERLAISLVPFISLPAGKEQRPLRRLRSSFEPGSRGIVITTGKKRFRYACHLVLNIRHILGSTLPIQIAYAGESDLPPSYREVIAALGNNITTLDVTTIFDDSTLGLPQGGWAIKVFAALGSTFEQVMLLDADAVFLQKPEVIFDTYPGYLETGTLLFHDRLLWQGAFEERHDWWEKELAHTELSETIKHSKVFVDKFAEEGDSGVVVADKARLEVFIGLLHICWQNTKAVRDAWTYRLGYGDKESWWFGFELAATPYAIEKHYGAVVGHSMQKEGDGPRRVCSFTIAHVDHRDKLLWYNGSLLKNKEVDLNDFDVPTEWMIDGVWEKGNTKQDLSCMRDAEIQHLDDSEVEILTKTVDAARHVDQQIRQSLPG